MADVRLVPLYPASESPTKDTVPASLVSGIPGDTRRIPLYPPSEVPLNSSISAASFTGVLGDTRRIPLGAPGEVLSDVLPTNTLLGTVVSGGGGPPALAPTTSSFPASAPAGRLIALVTNLNSGETLTAISPNDGRVRLASGGALIVGLTSSSAGTINYTVTTSAGRTLVCAITAGSAPATVAASRLTPNDYYGEEWASTAPQKLHYVPWTLVNPIEPGIARDDTRPGTGVETAAWPLTSLARVYDKTQDVLVVGGVHTSSAQRSSAIKITKGRHARLIGLNLGEDALNCEKQYGSMYIEGIRGLYYNAVNNTDAINFAGADPANPDEVPALAFAQNIHVAGMNSTNRLGDRVGVAISTIKMTGAATATVTLAAPITGGIANLPGTVTGTRTVYIGSTVLDGTKSLPLEGFNDEWDVDFTKANTDTVLFLKSPFLTSNKPGTASDGTGGRLYLQGGVGGAEINPHADGIQIEDTNGKAVAAFYGDKISIYSSYQAFIGGHNGNAVYLSRCNFAHKFIKPDGVTYLDPMDSQSGMIYLYTKAGLTPPREFYEVYLNNRRLSSLLGGGGFFSGSGGGQLTTLGAELRSTIWWPQSSYPVWRGIVQRYSDADALADFCPYAWTGASDTLYVSPGYSNHVPGAGTISAISFTQDSTTVTENGPAGQSLGRVDAMHLWPDGTTGKGEIVDVYITADPGQNLKLLGNQLVRGKFGINFETLPKLTPGSADTDPRPLAFELTAKIRGTNTTRVQQFAVMVADDGAAATTPTLTYLGQATNGASGATFTTPSMSLGAADADRDIYVPIDLRCSSTLRTVSTTTKPVLTTTDGAGAVVGTYTLEFVGQRTQGVIGSVEIWKAKAPLGVNGTVAITATGSCNHIAASLYRGLGIAANAFGAFGNSGPANVAGSGDTVSVTASAPAGSIVLAAATYGVSGGKGYHTGASGVIPVGDTVINVTRNNAELFANWTFGGTMKIKDYDSEVENSGNNPLILLAVVLTGRG